LDPVRIGVARGGEGLPLVFTRLPGASRIHRHHRRVTPAGALHPAAVAAWWSLPAGELLASLGSTERGLDAVQAQDRLAMHGPNALEEHHLRATWELLVRQLATPLQLILVFAAGVSVLAGEWVDAAVVFSIVLGSSALGTLQEARAGRAVAALRARLVHRVSVRRDGMPVTIPAREVVPGDLVLLTAGSLVPADGRLLEARDLTVSEAALTGETFPVEKLPAELAVDVPLAGRRNCGWMGTTVQSGTGVLLVVCTGAATSYGAIASRLAGRAEDTELGRGLRRFGLLLTEVMVALVLLVVVANVWFARPPLEALLFALALAVGLSPELLPAVLALNLAAGARRMAAQGVIVRRLEAIENLGSMNVLCTDKTGTLTTGAVRLAAAVDVAGQPAVGVAQAAWRNARLQTGLPNPLDEAILAAGPPPRSAPPAAGSITGREAASAGARASVVEVDGAIAAAPATEDAWLVGVEKVDEIPYDFVRRRLGVVYRLGQGPPLLVVKGAVAEVLAQSTWVAAPAAPGGAALEVVPERFAAVEPAAVAAGGPDAVLGRRPLGAAERDELAARVAAWAEAGERVLAVGARSLPGRLPPFRREDERELTLLGFLRFCDPPKADVPRVLRALADAGVAVKVVSGDQRAVAVALARAVGLAAEPVLDGQTLRAMSEEALWQAAPQTSLFVEVDPGQKERVLRALRRAGHVVGYLGDGINDAPALAVADVGISVDRAVEVAREAADLVLLAPDLDLLRQGIVEGRRTHANALKYLFTTTSANFGNMVSMAVASFALPFLPLLASQILLNNFLSDFPALALAADRVDPEQVARPRRFDIPSMQRFLWLFGGISSLFDLALFALLAGWLAVSADTFRTAWFVLSLLTEVAVALVVRTARSCLASRPSGALLGASALVAVVALALPYLPLSPWFRLVPLPPELFALVVALTVLYVLVTELAKRWFGGIL
jgi:Mg2+-importing ATPase